MVVAYAAAVLMGTTLGIMGAGGSILTVPILVYLFKISPSVATAYSLFVVGLTSAFASFYYFKRKQVNLPTGLTFAGPAFLGVYLTRAFVIPRLPETLTVFKAFSFPKESFILFVFAIVMILAALSMIRLRPRPKSSSGIKGSSKYLLILLEGLIVGGITGFVGAGGGFLIIPALVLLIGLDMKVAVGTSLFIISIKSLLGFLGDVQHNPDLDWSFLLFFSALSILGMWIGTAVSNRLDSQKLKPAFGWFVLVMGSFILLKELWF